jgi:hypothetical protein
MKKRDTTTLEEGIVKATLVKTIVIKPGPARRVDLVAGPVRV